MNKIKTLSDLQIMVDCEMGDFVNAIETGNNTQIQRSYGCLTGLYRAMKFLDLVTYPEHNSSIYKVIDLLVSGKRSKFWEVK
jgi:hypothetical protein